MTGRKWTDAPQEAWLKQQFPSFLQADSTATRRKFFGDVCVEWQKKWPDTEPSPGELATAGGDIDAAINFKQKTMDKRIRAWFDNHKRPTLSGKMDASVASRSLLNLSRQRVWQPWQAYSDLKYDDLKAEIKSQFDVLVKKWDEGHVEGEKRPILFTFQNVFLKERLEAESEEVKALVEAHRLKMLEVPPDELNRKYQIAIDKLPLTFATIMDNIAKQTGWNITIMAGGPRPNDEGKITTLTYTTGKTKDGRDFKEFLGSQLELMEGPYDDFLHECFTAEDCAARALSDVERDGQVDDAYEKEGEEKVDETVNNETNSTTKKSKVKGRSKDVPQWKKSEYEIEKERKIAENQAILAKIKGPEFEAAMGELKKGPSVPRKKNKANADVEPVEERRTSARLNATNRTSNSTNGDSASHGNNADLNGKPNRNSGNIADDTAKEVEVGAENPATDTETPADAVLEGPKQNNSDTEGSSNSSHQDDKAADRSPDHDDDVIMTDGSGHLGDESPTPTSCLPVASHSNVSPLNSTNTPGTNAFSDNENSALTSSSTAIVPRSPSQGPLATSTTTSQDGPAPADETSSLSTDIGEIPPRDEDLPTFLTAAVVAHLRGASSTDTWQNLVSVYLGFETANPPIGKLSTTARPPEVGLWIKRHVGKKHDPVTISNDYGARFRAWWTALQPSWRVTSSTSLSRAVPPKESWASLKKGGSSGSDDSQVMELADDLSWVLSLMTPGASPSTLSPASVKRRSVGSPDHEEHDPRPAKRVRS